MAYNTLHTKGPANVDSLLATTRETILRMKDFLQDQIFLKIGLLKFLQEKAQLSSQGGSSILVPIMQGKNSTVASYSGDDVIDVTGQEGMTMAVGPLGVYA